VGAQASGYLPMRQSLTVAGSTRASLSFTLQPTEARLAHLEIRCPVPGALVFVDGIPVGKTPLDASVTVLPGTRVVEIRRPGYALARRELALTDGARGELAIELDESAHEGPRGSLRLNAVEGDVFVSIDGRNRGVYHQTLSLPAGPHLIKLERAGFESLQRMVEIPPVGELAVNAGLRPTVETREAYVSRARAFRHWAYAALISGVVVAGGSTGLALWGQNKYSSAQSTLSRVEQDNVFRGNGSCDRSYALTDAKIAECDKSLADARNDVNHTRTLRTVGIVGAIGGAALIGTSVALWLLGPDPNRYEKGDALASRLIPILVAGPGSASFAVVGRF
jgi:PEGA domain